MVMRRRRGPLVVAVAAVLILQTLAAAKTYPAARVQNESLQCYVDFFKGLPVWIWSQVGGRRRQWLSSQLRMTVRNEVTGKVHAAAVKVAPKTDSDGVGVRREMRDLGLTVHERWRAEKSCITWDLSFTGAARRVGHEITIEMPVLAEQLSVFTPGERGVMSVAAYPSHRPREYATTGWGAGGAAYVLPLVSVLDPRTDSALTVALRPDRNIPHLHVDWTGGKVLRLRMGHRGMGDAAPSELQLRFYAHPADYRSVLKAYSDDFPRYFQPVLPRGRYEGAFWYHHIHNHPDFDEMARQNVRYIWSSFWFTHLGEYLPAEKQWRPYTYARWWKLRETMSDEKIRAFVEKMHAAGIGTYAYFNVTEYGGAGGGSGDARRAAKILKETFADALFKGPDGKPVPTWEGSMAMNPGAKYSLRPFLREQVRRHLTRLGEIDGFVIDRLDWANLKDYGHSDGLTMIGARAAENMALPVGDAVREVCLTAHAAGKRVFVNQFWRVEVLADVDGYCHEYDYARGLGYLSPYRPVSAWHHREAYGGDLLRFEAQLKRRLQFAIMPQMIAHKFPISQQSANPRAADMLEIYAPLFEKLMGKRQVLRPHCVSVSGENDVNLFVNGEGHYLVPVTSRVRFLSRQCRAAEDVKVVVSVPDAAELKWAHVYSADARPRQAKITAEADRAVVTLDRHGTSSMVVVGKGLPPKLRTDGARPAPISPRVKTPGGSPPQPKPCKRPDVPAAADMAIRIRGVHVGWPGVVTVSADGGKPQRIGADGRATLALGKGKLPAEPPALTFAPGDEGTWFVPERAELVVLSAGGKADRVASWHPGMPSLRLQWCQPVELARASAKFAGKETALGGAWRGRFGAKGVWMPHVAGRGGYRVAVRAGKAFTWSRGVADARVLAAGKTAAATCWFGDREVALTVEPPDGKPYRLTIYVLDFDRNGRAMEVAVRDEITTLDRQTVGVAETDKGAYLSWVVTGAVSVKLTKAAGFNVVLSGVFIDPAER